MNLMEIREKLDELDKEIVKILSQRMALIPAVAEYKKKNDVPRYQPKRETEIIQHKRKMAEELNLNPDLVEDIFKTIIKDSHRIEKDILGC